MRNTKHRLGEKPQYATFGTLLFRLRQGAGIAQQSDLATRIKTTQQTVSRWEKGISRPRDKQMPLLASVLKADLAELLTAAGYTTRVTVSTFDKPFPVEALSPESFERFCHAFLQKLYSKADVHRAGKSGHTQDGLDVEVIFPDETCHTFQCKRVDEFGPSKVRLAVAQHTRAATKKFLLLSRVASPQARQEIREYAHWAIWDKEDIAQHIRALPKEDQRQLVDTFFRGQRLALLGETEPGPWQTSEAFFAPFSGHGVFSHAWNLVGKTEETRAVVERLSNANGQIVFLVGAGGAGKSRVLKQAIERYESDNRGVLVRFLSPTEEVTNKSLEDLGDRAKVLVVDDAHDRNDLQLLFQYTAIPTNKTTLLLSFRPYGLDYIKSQASHFALVGERIREVKLDPLNLEQATALAKQVLEAFGGPVAIAKDIARRTLDCPLAIVIGAQVVAKEKRPFELVNNEDAFRSTLLGKFRDVIAGNIGNKNDAEPIRKLLRVLALLQPFHPDDPSISTVVECVEGLRASEVNRLIRLLTDAGVLFKRGGQYRLSPDLLADYIIEDACVGQEGKSTGYAEHVFDTASKDCIEHLLLNLGKLDWRRANGNPSNSRLLDGVWRKLQPSLDYVEPYIKAVTAVAYYQPARALNFAEYLIREEKYLHSLPDLIKHAAYNFEHLPRACEYLWELGKSDDRALNQDPGHAIRILSELCAVEPNKPIEYDRVVVDFGLSLLDQHDSWNQAYTPFDILEGILRTEGQTTESHGRSISFNQYLVSFRAVSALRGKVIDATTKLLAHSNTKIAVLAARFLQNSIHYPMDASTEERARWTGEFVQTLEKIEQATQTAHLDPLVLIEIARSTSWHAHYAEEETTPLAKRIIMSLPDSLEFRTIFALIDGYGQLLEQMDFQEQEHEWNRHLEMLTNDLLSAYPDGEHLRVYIEQHLSHIDKNYIGGQASPYILYWRLMQSSSALAQATAQNALTHPESKTNQFAGKALSKLLGDNHANGLDIAQQFLASNCRDLSAVVGQAYSVFDPKESGYGRAELAMLRTILASHDPWIVSNAVGAVRMVAKHNQRLAINLLKCVDIGMSNKVADDVLLLFHDQEVPFRFLTSKDIDHFLEKLTRLPELKGHWIETFLAQVSQHHAMRAASFFMDRVECAANTNDWHYRPCNHGPYGYVPLRFRESPECGVILRRVARWMQSRREEKDTYFFHHRAAELFETMFHPFDSELISFLQDWVDTATPTDLRIMSHILREASPGLVFEHRPFVLRFLDKAKQYGKQILKDAETALYCSAVQGMRSGTPGEPFPEDLRMKEGAGKALNGLSPFSPAYHLYVSIQESAEQNIQRSLQDREVFED